MPLVGRKARLTATTKIVAGARTPPTTTQTNDGITNLPKMVQVGGDLEFEFAFGLNNFSHEVGAVQFDELSRPLQLPLLQPTAATLQKVSFDFLVARPLDGIAGPIDDELANLQNFATEDNSVIFVNVHQMMSQSVAAWKIQSMSVQISRYNELGQAVSAQVNMSCTEATEQLERFLTLPKFTYRNRRGTGGGSGSSTPPSGGNAHTVINKFFQSVKQGMEQGQRNEFIGKLNRLSAQYGGETNVLDVLVKTVGSKSDWQATDLFNLLSKNVVQASASRNANNNLK